MSPLPHSCPECGAVLDDPKDQSDPMRRRFFAIVREAWHNLPDDKRERFPSSEILRKTALCRVGWAESRQITCGNRKAALEVAILARHLDRYAIVDVSETVVTVFTARSMSKRQCPKKTFLEVSERALDWVSALLGTDAATLGQVAA